MYFSREKKTDSEMSYMLKLVNKRFKVALPIYPKEVKQVYSHE